MRLPLSFLAMMSLLAAPAWHTSVAMQECASLAGATPCVEASAFGSGPQEIHCRGTEQATQLVLLVDLTSEPLGYGYIVFVEDCRNSGATWHASWTLRAASENHAMPAAIGVSWAATTEGCSFDASATAGAFWMFDGNTLAASRACGSAGPPFIVYAPLP